MILSRLRRYGSMILKSWVVLGRRKNNFGYILRIKESIYFSFKFRGREE